ncbi:hypothetical protein JTE90_007432 [Oedothorax gibbosus]|uniref:Uncharacterized protein n=1 Tax=Oedothorax gibbosus TaxID=931172 RepID=A0AAV6URX5_9ARAC|nr:hypothetical protein JTE90_007432 [Oedothorax gibbosus]
MEIFPGRTKESIKCRRKNPNYGMPVEIVARRRRAVDPAIHGATTSQTASSRPRIFSINTETKARKGKQRKPKVNGQSVISKRKLKNQKYAEMQKLYKKKRSACYNSIFENNSFSDNLDAPTMSGF